MNSDSNGGNDFIRSKIYRARERLELEIKERMGDIDDSAPSN
jgi:hypothetical protein